MRCLVRGCETLTAGGLPSASSTETGADGALVAPCLSVTVNVTVYALRSAKVWVVVGVVVSAVVPSPKSQWYVAIPPPAAASGSRDFEASNVAGTFWRTLVVGAA